MKLENKKFTVESGEERWDYDCDVPRKEVIDYWVMFGKEVIRKFSYESDAKKFANKLNEFLIKL